VQELPRAHRCVQFGPFEADLASKELRKRGLRLRLQDKPFQILELLLEQPGEIVSRETLQSRLWPSGTYVDFDKGLNTAIKKLRQALGDSAETPIYIETLPRRGYRFLVPVNFNGNDRSLAASDVGVRSNGTVSCPENGSEASSKERGGGENERGMRNRRRVVAISAIAMTVVVIAATLTWRSQRRFEPSTNLDLKNLRMTLVTNNGQVRFATLSPDGRSIAYALRNGVGQSLWIRDMTTNTETQILEPDTVNIPGLTFSPDGRYLYFPRSEKLNPVFGDMCRVPTQGGAVEQLIRDADSTPSFSPDGTKFVYTRGYPPKNLTDVRIANANGSDDHVLKSIEGHQVFDAGATWSPDGKVIAVSIQKFAESRFALYEIAAIDGKTEEVYSSTRSIGRPVWTDDGKSLLLSLEDERTGRGQLWTMSRRGGEARRLTNDLSDYGSAISVSADQRTVLTVVNGADSDLWWADARDLSALRQATTKGSLFGVRSLADGRLLTYGDGIFLLNADGSNSTRISDLRNLDLVESCGSYAIAQVHSGTKWSMRRIGLGPSAPTALVSGDVHFPACSPDGRDLFYMNFDHPELIHRITVDGSVSSIVAQVQGDTYFGPISVSPDGRLLAYSYQQYSPPRVYIVLLSLEDGTMVGKFDAPGYGWSAIHWSVDGSAVEYVMSRDGTDNLWSQELRGGKPKQMTRFASGQIFDFAWSRDGKKLFLARGHATRDILLMSEAGLAR
jgi:Tol biopolymer transport system component/DNA-binding winged helix-turn-helix (wHTH) protein